jgi:hypothetical protein
MGKVWCSIPNYSTGRSLHCAGSFGGISKNINPRHYEVTAFSRVFVSILQYILPFVFNIVTINFVISVLIAQFEVARSAHRQLQLISTDNMTVRLQFKFTLLFDDRDLKAGTNFQGSKKHTCVCLLLLENSESRTYIRAVTVSFLLFDVLPLRPGNLLSSTPSCRDKRTLCYHHCRLGGALQVWEALWLKPPIQVIQSPRSEKFRPKWVPRSMALGTLERTRGSRAPFEKLPANFVSRWTFSVWQAQVVRSVQGTFRTLLRVYTFLRQRGWESADGADRPSFISASSGSLHRLIVGSRRGSLDTLLGVLERSVTVAALFKDGINMEEEDRAQQAWRYKPLAHPGSSRTPWQLLQDVAIARCTLAMHGAQLCRSQLASHLCTVQGTMSK